MAPTFRNGSYNPKRKSATFMPEGQKWKVSALVLQQPFYRWYPEQQERPTKLLHGSYFTQTVHLSYHAGLYYMFTWF